MLFLRKVCSVGLTLACTFNLSQSRSFGMSKLYYTKTSCAAASFISAYIAKVQIETEQVNLADHTTFSGVDFYQVNPKGNVPTLVLEDGTVLAEGVAILQWIADQAPGTIAPPNGTTERYKVQAALNLVSSEIHPSIGFRFSKSLPGSELHTYGENRIKTKLTYLNNIEFKEKTYLVGDKFTIADSYLYIVLSWLKPEDWEPYPVLKAYYERIRSMPEVQAAHDRIATNPTTSI